MTKKYKVSINLCRLCKDKPNQKTWCGWCKTIYRKKTLKKQNKWNVLCHKINSSYRTRGGGDTYQIRKEDLEKIIVFYNNKCAYCSYDFDFSQLSFDHIIPLCKGGSNHPENLVLCCLNCNFRKGKKEIYPMKLSPKAKEFFDKNQDVYFPYKKLKAQHKATPIFLNEQYNTQAHTKKTCQKQIQYYLSLAIMAKRYLKIPLKTTIPKFIQGFTFSNMTEAEIDAALDERNWRVL